MLPEPCILMGMPTPPNEVLVQLPDCVYLGLH